MDPGQNKECYQSFRIVYNDGSTYSPNPEPEDFQVECHYDKSIVIRDDISAIYNDMLSIPNGEKSISHIR